MKDSAATKPQDNGDVRRRLPKMEGFTARWYARQRGSASQLDAYRHQAAELIEALPDGADVLEVAPGPGYLAVEMARSGRVQVTGLDLSHTFVQLAGDYARRENVKVIFRQGDVEKMPLADNSFDLIICQAAFKNFGQPVVAINEMYRVLRPGGTAIIHDMSRESTPADITAEVRRMRLSGPNAFFVRRALGALRLRAATQEHFQNLAGRSAFGSATIRREAITTEVRLTKRLTKPA